MGGEIVVRSELGEGSCFSFELQVRNAPQDAQRAAKRGAVVVGGTSVLIVDDNQTNRLILEEIVSSWGLIPTLVDSGQGALDELRAANQRGKRFGLVISDVNMPEMSGYDFIANVRQDDTIKNTPIMVLTSGHREGEEILRLQYNIDESLLKPVKQSELFDSIVRVLGVNAPDEDGQHPASQTNDDVRALKILLAEDNLINQKLAIGVLSRDGHQVTVAHDGNQAIDLVKQNRFDVVLMDVQMPIMDGLEATRAIRQYESESNTRTRIPIIAMTAHAMKGDREKCLDSGMDDYIAKPIRMNVLREQIQMLCGHAGAHSGAHSSGSPIERAKQTEPATGDCDANSVEETRDAIDWDHAHATVGGDPDLLSELMSVYLGESTLLLRHINTAHQQHDRETLRRLIHTLKGASLSIGAVCTSEIAGLLEQDVETIEASMLTTRIDELRVETQRVITVIESRLQK